MISTYDLEYDFQLNLNTTENELVSNEVLSNYEATPYASLLQFFGKYSLREFDHIIDIGCGKGRVLFLLDHMYDMGKITGIEINKKVFDMLQENMLYYRFSSACRIKVYNIGIDDFKFTDENIFFLFNPFHLKLFVKFIYRVLKLQRNDIMIYLFSPAIEYTLFLDTIDKLYLVERIAITTDDCFLYTRKNNERIL